MSYLFKRIKVASENSVFFLLHLFSNNLKLFLRALLRIKVRMRSWDRELPALKGFFTVIILPGSQQIGPFFAKKLQQTNHKA